MCLLSQQKYNKTVQVPVTRIPRQPGKELSVIRDETGLFFGNSEKSLDSAVIEKFHREMQKP